VSFAAITICVASQRVFIVVVYFVTDSVRKLLDTTLYGFMENLDHESKSGLRHGCMFTSLCVVLYCIGRYPAMSRSPMKKSYQNASE